MKKSSKPRLYPNKETQWSCFMQAIEPNNVVINTAFPEYQPMWVIQSQRKTVSATNFKYMREYMLNMTVEQCAAYLRIHRTTINRWENGESTIPFMAFELLRLVFESANFRLSHKNWQGWFINQDGRLVSPDRGNLSFSSDELSFIRESHQVKAMYESENTKLRKEIEPLRAEIAELRALTGNDGLLDELKAIEARLAELSSRVGSNKVVRMVNSSKTTNPILEAKVA